MGTPATMVVMLAVAVIVIAGLALIVAGRSEAWRRGGDVGQRSETRVCRAPDCGHENPGKAKFCGSCGAALKSDDDEIVKNTND